MRKPSSIPLCDVDQLPQEVPKLIPRVSDAVLNDLADGLKLTDITGQSLEAQVLLDRIRKLALDEVEESEEVQTRRRDHLPSAHSSCTFGRGLY